MTVTSGKNGLYWLHAAIFFLLMFGISHIPPSPPLTPNGMKVLGIFCGVLYAWTFISISWPSMAGLIALMLLDVMKPVQLLNKSFGDPIVVMMLFIFIFCAAINHYGLARFISLWFISRKCIIGKPWAFTYTFLATIMILGGLTSGTPASLLGWSLLYAVCDLCGYRKGDRYATMMIIGVVFAAQFGMAIIPFKAAPLAIMGTYENISHTSLDYAPYMFLSLAGAFLLLGLFIFVGKILFRPDVSGLRTLDMARLDAEHALRLSPVQKLVMLFLFILLGGMLAPSILPADFFLTRFIRSIGNTGLCILIVMTMCCIRVNGSPLLPLKQMIDKGIAWDIIFLLTFVFAISGPMGNPENGITRFFMLALAPVFGQDSQIIFALCLSAFSVLLTQFCNNAALGAALMPLIYSYCSANHLPPEVSITLVTLSVHLAFLTPAASSPAALLHGNEWCTPRDVWKTMPLIVALSYILLVALVLGIGHFIF